MRLTRTLTLPTGMSMTFGCAMPAQSKTQEPQDNPRPATAEPEAQAASPPPPSMPTQSLPAPYPR